VPPDIPSDMAVETEKFRSPTVASGLLSTIDKPVARLDRANDASHS
jgi:hypothetical protein